MSPRTRLLRRAAATATTTRTATTAALAAVALAIAGLVLVVVPPGGPPPAEAAVRVAKETCRSIDPHLVNGACLRYRTAQGEGLTWIGTYRAPDGRVFFCIDFLYDSRLPASASTVPTQGLVNQLGERVGDAEVAALNFVISRWAGHGTTGSDDRDAAIALVVREVMGDGRTPDGVGVYPAGLEVGEQVAPPVGGLDGRVVRMARSMWRAASISRGPHRLTLRDEQRGPVRLGRTRGYRVSVVSAAGHRVPGVRVRLACSGPVTCRRGVVTTRRGAVVRVRPTDVGRFRIVATASAPSSDGLLFRQRGWRTHDGSTARPAGVQRGWIAQESTARAVVAARATVERARPTVRTRTSEAVVTPGATIHDVVTVSGLPPGYSARVSARLYGPFASHPEPDDCVPHTRAARVRFEVAGNATFTTPGVSVDEVGYYTWVERFPGDRRTVATTTRCGLVAETTRVVPFTPTVATVVSTRRAHVGDQLHDTVHLGGVSDTPVTIAWSLLGPVAPVDDTCRGRSWSTARVAAQGTMAVPGDGTYVTPSTTLRSRGCYTFAQQVAATSHSNEASSPPGLASETALVVRRTPVVTTRASDQQARVGVSLHDSVRLRGLRRSDRVAVRWRLHGPLAPRAGSSCDALAWGSAPVVDRGELTAHGNGRYRTGAATLRAPGCYSYGVRLTPGDTTEAAVSEPGLAPETALVTRPPTPYVPEVPSGAATSPSRHLAPLRLGRLDGASGFEPGVRAQPRYLRRAYQRPTDARRGAGAGTVRLDRVGVRVSVTAVGLDDGVMAVPDGRREMGWLSTTAASGDVVGSSVLSGHVSDLPGGLGRLREARRGDVVTWTGADGVAHRFVVREVRRVPRSRGLPSGLFRADGPHLLHLVTCDDLRRGRDGRTYYADNLVVTAEAVR